LSGSTRRRLALKAFQHTASYDAAISQWLADNDPEIEAEVFPDALIISLEKADELRYGENPHQRAALYGGFLEIAKPLHGRALSYNNLIDAQAALALIVDFDPADRAVVAILKHNTPCGVGAGASPLEAYENAFATDPDSPFGGIIVSNQPFDLALADKVAEIFTAVLIGPSFTEEALSLLKKKKNRRLLAFDREKIDPAQLGVRRVFGGLLVQQSDPAPVEVTTASLATEAAPSEEQRRAMEFAWRVVKHVKSNAIVYARDRATLGVGAGQMSRIDASEIAIAKGLKSGLDFNNCVVASDAFFPFADGLLAAARVGATAAIQPGGSVRDDEVISAANEKGMAMVFTGKRHFKH